MRELREDTFSRNKNEDAHDHVDRVLNIISLFNILGVSQDAILLHVFPITLTRSAKRWVDRLTPGAVNTWDLIKKAFIQRYCPLTKTAKRLEDIHNFKQESDKSLYQAWERYNDLLYKCPTHDINSHQKGPIPSMTPTQALTAIQTMVDHSHKWHEGTSSRNISRNSNTDGLAVIEVKYLEEVKYGEFGRSAPFNGSNRAKFHVGPPRYYTRTDNRPPYREKRPSLEELMNKHQEESARKSAKLKEWFKKLQENAEINTRNQSASLKNLETQIEQLTKELHSRTTNVTPSLSTEQCKVVNDDHETQHKPISSRKLNNKEE
ncbi:hypothetical protein Tco_1366304 [Tanacetum coccineum]